MPFNSIQYILFLPIVWSILHVVGKRWGWCVLLVASLSFYAALGVPYLLAVLSLVALTTYLFGLAIDQAADTRVRSVLLWSGVAANVSVLTLMKYLPFLAENLRELATLLSLKSQIQPSKAFVAIGVSYYVFQALSYLFDVYLEAEKPERHFGYFALYLAFFPKLLQGPIERGGDLIQQLKSGYVFNYDNMRFGMLLFCWGLFKKIVIADRLGLYVDAVYKDVHAFTGLPLLLATYAYSFQIYLDFSGYTDMALGSAKLFNINLTQNFNSPYLATSIADFWRRWHISFSRWILDYIFKPLQMRWRTRKNWGSASALVIAFLVSGLWHGASWGFVIWGGLHGLYMACSVFYKPYQKRLHKAFGLDGTRLLKVWQVVVVFNLVSFSWIFFRAYNLADAIYIIKNMLNGVQGVGRFLALSNANNLLAIAIGLSSVMMGACALPRLKEYVLDRSWCRWAVYYALLYSVLYLGKYEGSGFIYTKF